MTLRLSLLTPWLLIVAGCASVGAGSVAQQRPAVRIIDRGPNAVALWDERAAAIINQQPVPAGTPEERRPAYQLDLATLHLSIHEAVSASPPASQDAAAHAAGYTVLKTLFVGFVACNGESVSQLHVRVGCHRRGIGSALLRIAKDASSGSLWLYTFARNLNARRFYERQGFVATAFGFEPMWQLDDVRYMWQRRGEVVNTA